MTQTFRCWCPDEGDETSAKAIQADVPAQAAEEWASINWGDLDHPDEVEVCVRATDASSRLVQYTVEVERTVVFSAWPSDPAKVSGPKKTEPTP